MLASDLELPELLASAAPESAVDLFIREVERPIDANVELPRGHEELEVFTLSNEFFGFRISFGRLIEVWTGDRADPEVVRALLLGPVLTVALHQLRLWPLHVGAVRSGDEAWLISGPSGAGKSTLVTYLATRLGMGPLGDDAGVLSESGRGLEFAGASRAFRLTMESYKLLLDGRAQATVNLPNPIDNKIRVRLEEPELSALRLPVAGMIRICDAQEGGDPTVRLKKLGGFRAAEAVRAALFQPFAGHRLRGAAETLRFCAGVARRLPIYELQRVRDLRALPAVAARLQELFLAHVTDCTMKSLEEPK